MQIMSEESPETPEIKEEIVQQVSQEPAIDPNAERIAALEETINRQNEMLARLAQSQSQSPPPVQRSPYETIKDDELVEGIHVKNLSRQTEALQKKLDEMEEAAVQTRYNDLNEVVTKQNLAELQKRYPTVFNTLAVGSTGTKLTNAYLHIKNYIIGNQTQKESVKRQPIPQARPSITDMDGAHRSPEEYVPFNGDLTPEQKEVIRRRKDEQIARYRKTLANIG